MSGCGDNSQSVWMVISEEGHGGLGQEGAYGEESRDGFRNRACRKKWRACPGELRLLAGSWRAWTLFSATSPRCLGSMSIWLESGTHSTVIRGFPIKREYHLITLNIFTDIHEGEAGGWLHW